VKEEREVSERGGKKEGGWDERERDKEEEAKKGWRYEGG
jgi:hypothetical protein